MVVFWSQWLIISLEGAPWIAGKRFPELKSDCLGPSFLLLGLFKGQHPQTSSLGWTSRTGSSHWKNMSCQAPSSQTLGSESQSLGATTKNTLTCIYIWERWDQEKGSPEVSKSGQVYIKQQQQSVFQIGGIPVIVISSTWHCVWKQTSSQSNKRIILSL